MEGTILQTPKTPDFETVHLNEDFTGPKHTRSSARKLARDHARGGNLD